MPHCLALCLFPHARLESAQGEAERELMPLIQQATSRPPLVDESWTLSNVVWYYVGHPETCHQHSGSTEQASSPHQRNKLGQVM